MVIFEPISPKPQGGVERDTVRLEADFSLAARL